MATPFTDNVGREWLVCLDFEKVAEIKKLLGVDLFDDSPPQPDQPHLLDELTRDPERTGKLFAIAVPLEDVGDAKSLAQGLRGEGLDRALVAFYAELADFFPGGRRLAFLAMVGKALAYELYQGEEAAKAWEKITPRQIRSANDALPAGGNLSASPARPTTATTPSTANTRGRPASAPNSRPTRGKPSTKCGGPAASRRGRSPGGGTCGSSSVGGAIIGK